MCGIAGIIGEVSRDTIAMMTSSLAHRGPDGEGTVCVEEEGFAFGHRRLAIIDLSPAAAQPMSDPSGRYWITYNGEVYNHASLRADLEARGRVFRSRSDTEVVLAAWEIWGAQSLHRLNGMFAFAIWDRKTRSLFAARDRLGIKPLYWAMPRDSLLFASEVKAILASGCLRAEADPEVTHNPWHFPTAPRTGFLGIHKIPPGHLLMWKEGRVHLDRWWSIPVGSEDPGWGKAREELAGLLDDAVGLQRQGDVPVGVLLSGGLDSSTIVALMRRWDVNPLHTFCIAFRSQDRMFEAVGEDSRYARLVAERFDCSHHEIVIAPDIVTLLPKLVWHLDEPAIDVAALNTYLIAEEARGSGVPVLLSGQGADEIFGGYRKYLACLLADCYQAMLPRLLRNGVESLIGRLPVAGEQLGFRTTRWATRFLGFASLAPVERFLRSDLSLTPSMYGDLFKDSGIHPYEGLAEVAARKTAFADRGCSYLQAMCLADAETFLPDHNLNYMDKAAMAMGVETRPPLLDHRIVEFVFGLADRFRIRRTTQKSLLRSAAARLLPKQVLSRPKAPFGAPLRAWIRNDLREMVDDLLSPEALRARGLYRPEVVRSLIDADRRGKADHAHFVWNLLWREIWFRQFTDKPLDLRESPSAFVERVGTILPGVTSTPTNRREVQGVWRGW